MDIYTIEQITDPDYGCEETRRPEPAVLLKLQEEESENVRYLELPERILAEQGLAEGKKVTFAADGSIRKYVRVVAAVIRDPKHHAGKIFATARGYGEYKGWWEFPGGKIEMGETPQEALKREIREELATDISVGELIKTIEYDYPKFHLSMDCFWANVVSGYLELKEAEDARWLLAKDLSSVKWLPADRELIRDITLSEVKILSNLICIVRETENTFGQINEYFKKHPVKNDGESGRVWFLSGKEKEKNDSENILMVAQSEDIMTEIIADVKAMLNYEYKRRVKQYPQQDNEEYNLDIIEPTEYATIDSNGMRYPFRKGHERKKKQYLYRYILKTYKDLQFYELRIDDYLNPMRCKNEIATTLYDLGKDYYAESKLAVDTDALFWNYYKSGVGKRVYLMCKRIKDEYSNLRHKEM